MYTDILNFLKELKEEYDYKIYIGKENYINYRDNDELTLAMITLKYVNELKKDLEKLKKIIKNFELKKLKDEGE